VHVAVTIACAFATRDDARPPNRSVVRRALQWLQIGGPTACGVMMK
jgi:hypothetical protein